ncbi:MAG: TMEM175 family protein [Prolixibacteraceae bacterium]
MKENARIEAFSDGVFAIAITLLVLELKVPPVSSVHSVSDLWDGLVHLWPSYFAFTLSFGILLVSWVNHHSLFTMLDKSSRPFLYANGFLLFTITFMPFPTALLAEYISTDFAKPAIAFYCFGGVVNSIGWNLLIYTLYRPQNLIHSEIHLKLVNKIKLSTQYGFVIYSVTTVIAFWFPIVALIINLLLWLLWISLSIMEKTTE